MPIQQIYCTHCTYGTSVLELREGDVADRVLGYSARAASLDRHELKGYYRQIERFVNYYLPADTPPEEKSRLDAATAPRRFFFCPAIGNLQIVGQVSYRQSDTAGRIGSYFAHVLFAPIEAAESHPRGASAPAVAGMASVKPASGSAGDSSSAVVAAPKRANDARRGEKHEVWPAAKCLQLWDAPWVVADSPSLPLKLDPLETIDALWDGAGPVLNDELLLTFLQTPAGGDFSDPAGVVPARWRAKEPAERADLLVQAMQGLLDLGSHRRDNVLLVIEPSVAALVFYGIARLLPPAVLEGVSFSTYEPTADRLATTVAATTFFSPESSDVRPDLYRRRGFVWNTYTGRMSDAGRPLGDYARFIVEELLAGGWKVADRLVRGFADSGVRRPEELTALIRTHHQVDQLFSASLLSSDAWRSSPVAEKYLQGEVRRRLADAPPGWPDLHVVASSPNHLAVLELVAGDSAPTDLHGPAQFLLRRLPPEKFPEMLASPRIAEPAKLDALQHYVTSFNRLPDECQSLWSEEAGAPGGGGPHTRPLLEKLLARLPEQVLSQFRASVPDAQWKSFLRIAMRAGRIESRSQAAIKRLVLEAIVGLDEVRLIEALIEHGDALRSCCPPPEPALGKRLHRLLYDLPAHPTHFSTWLDTLSGWSDYFSEPGMAEQRLGHWRKVRAVLLSLPGAEAEQPSGLLRKKTPPVDYRGLAEALGRAMPMASYPDDAAGKRKQVALRKIGMAILNRSEVLPAVVWTRMSRFFEYGDWDEGRGRGGAKKQGKKKRRQGAPAAADHRHRSWLVYGLVAAGAVVLMVAAVWGITHFRGPRGGQAPTTTVATVGGPAANPPANSSAAPPHVSGNQSNTPATPTTQPTIPVQQQPSPKTSSPLTADESHDGAPKQDVKPEPTTADDSPPPEGEPAKESPSAPDGENTPKPDSQVPATETNPAGASNTNTATTDGTAGKTVSSPVIPESAKVTPEASSEAHDDKERVEVDDAPIIVRNSCGLPPSDDNTARTIVTALDVQSNVTQLSLIGLDFVNRHLGEGRIEEEWADGDLKVNFRRDQNETIAPVTLATFTCDDEGISFQWADVAKSDDAARHSRDWLRRCVLRIESVAMGEDRDPARTKVAHISLFVAANIELPLSLTKGSTDFDQSSGAPQPVLPTQDDVLVLGPGYVFFDNRRISFGPSSPGSNSSYLLDPFPPFDSSQLEIGWLRDSKRRGVWQLRVRTSEDGELAKDEARLKRNRELIATINESSKAVETRLKSAGFMKAKAVEIIDDHIKTLASTLHVDNPPHYPPSPDKENVSAFRQQVEMRILAKAGARKKDLIDENREIQDRIAKPQKAIQSLQNRASVSCTVYLSIGENTIAPYAIVGTPGTGDPTEY